MTRTQLTKFTKAQDIAPPNDITGGGIAASKTVIESSALLPTPTDGARLRAKSLRGLNCPRSFIIELACQDTTDGLADLLADGSGGVLGRTIERFAHIAQRVGEALSQHMCRFMAGIKDLSMHLPADLMQATHEAFRPTAPTRFLREPRAQTPQHLVAVANGRLHAATANELGFLAIGRGDEGIHTQVNPNGGQRRACHVGDFTDELYLTKDESNFHQASRKMDANGDEQDASRSTRQPKPIAFHCCTLVGEDDIPVATIPPGIPRFGMSVLPELPSGVYRFTEVGDNLLHGLRVEGWEFAFGPLLQPLFRRPSPSMRSNTMVEFHKPRPQAPRFQARVRERFPLARALRQPMYGYRAIRHNAMIARCLEQCKTKDSSANTAAGIHRGS